MLDDTPDYASYSLADLQDVLARVNREQFPDRYEKIVREIERRETSGEVVQADQQEARRAHNSRTRFFATVALLLSCVFLFFGVEDVWLTWRSSSWTMVSCVITRRLDSSGMARVAFVYQVNGEKHTSDQLETSSGTSKSSAWSRAFPDGMKTHCFVNPSDPTEAVLRRGIGFGTVFLLFWCSIVISAMVRTHRRPEEVDEKGRPNPWKEPNA